MSTERTEGYIEGLTEVRATIRRRVNEAGVPEDGKLELLDLLSMLDDMLKADRAQDGTDETSPEPMSGSF
ncbi:hypothetical protein FPV16_24650 [Methylobacterium sp. W2]|uniref:hypothetical protein n=1 Tax=Methylobacterium sp. W2 TaxID=2598107 RepID=UPI001D0C7201|nr:hypothetical protein [Methylobacterium sp. W2]MCC0809348.1 hypothetical protein [Methylobacterium sp. W2]